MSVSPGHFLKHQAATLSGEHAAARPFITLSLFFFTITLCPYPPFLSPLYSRQNMPLFAYLLGESKREKEQGGRNIFLMQYPAKGCVILRMNSLLKVFGLWPNIYYTILSASILFLIYLKSFVSCVTLDTFLTWTKHQNVTIVFFEQIIVVIFQDV